MPWLGASSAAVQLVLPVAVARLESNIFQTFSKTIDIDFQTFSKTIVPSGSHFVVDIF
jgi:hypothetical protein